MTSHLTLDLSAGLTSKSSNILFYSRQTQRRTWLNPMILLLLLLNLPHQKIPLITASLLPTFDKEEGEVNNKEGRGGGIYCNMMAMVMISDKRRISTEKERRLDIYLWERKLKGWTRTFLQTTVPWRGGGVWWIHVFEQKEGLWKRRMLTWVPIRQLWQQRRWRGGGKVLWDILQEVCSRPCTAPKTSTRIW